MRYICLCLLACLFSTCLAPAQDNAKTPEAKKPNVDEKAIRALIGQLGDSAFDTREAAHKRLADLGEPALELLEKAAKESTDGEVRLRAADLIQGIESRFFNFVLSFRGHDKRASRRLCRPEPGLWRRVGGRASIRA